MNNKQLLIILITTTTLAGVVVASMFLLRSSKKPAVPPPPIQTAPSPSPLVGAKITFQQDRRDQLIDKINNHPQLKPADLAIKTKLIANIDKDGRLQATADYQTEYIAAFDLFQVKILSNNYPQAKAVAQSWFRDQGLSQEGICNLPIMFYLSAEVKNSLPNKDVGFNYLPEGC